APWATAAAASTALVRDSWVPWGNPTTDATAIAPPSGRVMAVTTGWTMAGATHTATQPREAAIAAPSRTSATVASGRRAACSMATGTGTNPRVPAPGPGSRHRA